MAVQAYPRSSSLLCALLVPAAVYLCWQYYLPFVTGAALVDGSAGILLGLYICSHPAANSIDLIFIERGAVKRILAARGAAGWLMLNALVMLVGWFVIVVGASRFTLGAGS
jgi:hypothetical protein